MTDTDDGQARGKPKGEPEHTPQPLVSKPWGRFLIYLADKEDEELVRIWNGYQRYLWEKIHGSLNKARPDSFSEEKWQKAQNLLGSLSQLTAADIKEIKRRVGVLPELSKGTVGREHLIKFFDLIDLSDVTFSESISPIFTGFIFAFHVDFTHAVFEGVARFEHAVFKKWVHFDHAAFEGGADFKHAVFKGCARFDHAVFKGWARFDHAVFKSMALFEHAVFKSSVYFDHAIFESFAFFRNTKFHDSTYFKASKFLAGCDFHVTGDDIRPSPLIFDDAEFEAHPPLLFNRPMHEATSWHDVKLPLTPKDRDNIRRHLNAYERLRLIARDLGKVSDEQLFFRYEMDCKRAAARLPNLPKGADKSHYKHEDADTSAGAAVRDNGLIPGQENEPADEQATPPENEMQNTLENGRVSAETNATETASQNETTLQAFFQKHIGKYLHPYLFWRWTSPRRYLGLSAYKIVSGYGYSVLRPAIGLGLTWFIGLLGWMYHLSALLLAKAPCLNYCMTSHWLAVWRGSLRCDIFIPDGFGDT